MAISKKKEAVKEAQAQTLEIKVKRAKDFTDEGADGCTISFDMEVNGVTIYGCWYREGKDKKGEDFSMVSFPSHKGKDGKYYSWAYVKLAKEDTENISKQIEELL